MGNPILYKDPEGDESREYRQDLLTGESTQVGYEGGSEYDVVTYYVQDDSGTTTDMGTEIIENPDISTQFKNDFDGPGEWSRKEGVVAEDGIPVYDDIKGLGLKQLLEGGVKMAIKKGTAFTPKEKEKVIEANKAKNGGVIKCENCDVETTKPAKSQKGVTPPKTDRQIDHKIPKAKGGNGEAKNGQVLCRECNRAKSDKVEPK